MNNPAKRLRILALAGLLLAVAVSCSLLRMAFAPAAPAPRPFNHAAHLARGPSCVDCHEGAEKEARAGMPSKETCMTCHEDIDKDPKALPERKVAWFLDGSGKPSWSAFLRQSTEIRFSHAEHAAKNVACTSCHAGIAENTGLVPGPPQRMDTCTACHAAQAPLKNECSTCHTEIARDRRPSNHARLWERTHGFASMDGGMGATANNCAMCHGKDSCTSCHLTRRPADHGAFWRTKGHGIASSIDRGRCQTCHVSDSCNRCHQESAPPSHGAGWNAPTNRHCQGCHVPLQASGSCAVCHKSSPGHEASPLKPSWHNAAMDCRSCHGATMKHPDNGDTCNACHR